MASFSGPPFSGKIGELIFYTIDGKTFARKAPVKVKQSKATKKTSIIFGKANKIAAALRKQVLPAIPVPADKNLYHRLTTNVYKWLRSGGTDPKPSTNIDFIGGF